MLRAVASQILSGTWANKPASAAQGSLYFASDVGEHGTMFQYGVSRWRAFNGRASLKTLTTTTANIANSETIVMQTLVPAGVLQAGDLLRVWFTSSKSGTTDAGLRSVRVGTAGTTGDTAIESAYTLMGTTARGGGSVTDFKVVSVTSTQRLGAASSGSGTYTSPSNTSALPVAVTVTDVSANAVYVSVSFYSGGTTDTVNVTSGSIELITP